MTEFLDVTWVAFGLTGRILSTAEMSEQPNPVPAGVFRSAVAITRLVNLTGSTMKPSKKCFALAVLVVPAYVSCGSLRDTPLSDAASSRPAAGTTFFQEASWSPDGSRLALSRLDIHDAYRSSIALINADGSGYTPLTSGPADMWTAWSPDGSRIAYASTVDDNRDIYVMTVDGSNRVRLTSHADEDTHPDWSPDGSRIAFVSRRDGASHVYVMQADGSNQIRISDTMEEKWNPHWSPDGRRIVYYGALEAGQDSVYVMNTDGSERSPLGAGIWPSWSVDGSRILFVLDDDVFEMKPDGTDRRRLFEDAVIARWSPDGSRIAFVRITWSAPDGWPARSSVFVIDETGSDEQRLTWD